MTVFRDVQIYQQVMCPCSGCTLNNSFALLQIFSVWFLESMQLSKQKVTGQLAWDWMKGQFIKIVFNYLNQFLGSSW